MGLPAGVPSDTGLAFSDNLRSCFEMLFEPNLREAGVGPPLALGITHRRLARSVKTCSAAPVPV